MSNSENISSGQGSANNEARNVFRQMQEIRWELVQGYTENEMKAYLAVKKCKYDFDTVKEHCGTKPLLLWIWTSYIKD